ncbi:hypothetical protein HMPREF0554_0977 [Pseudoleptotrichia goodfellowii F0264]|uniref:Uncharacterized protein n=1 Tax=Pseudoleptotrichia goodfellowii F0264 TaxID=596323 RepID=D0GJ84_9FUSO|nr:hypothetical protein HMPREF0554_0977 [Pseudoleptotrichia goodfellowii F0264]
MDLESLMTVKEHIEDLIAEKELSAESVSKCKIPTFFKKSRAKNF